jgi:transposase
MLYVGIDHHKKTTTFCIVGQDRAVITTRTFSCSDVDEIVTFLRRFRPFQAVVEATSGYQWLVERIEPMAERIILAHPKKLRIIAESTCKSDKVDARILAEFLALDMIPQAYRPTPRQREHRTLVRHRQFVQRQKSAVQVKIRRIVSDYNADRRDLFSQKGLEYLAALKLLDADRYVVKHLLAQWNHLVNELVAITKELQKFAKKASAQELKCREVLRSITGVGVVTTEAVISEVGDIKRFRSAKQVVAYAGLAPGRRQSAGKTKDLGITKAGSALLRTVLVEASWQLVRRSRYWGLVYEAIKVRRGARRAIVAVARRLLGVMVALMRSGQMYHEPRVRKAA